MCRKLLFLICLVLVLGLAGYTQAGSKLVAHYEFEGTDDFKNSVPGAVSKVGTPVGEVKVIWDEDRGSYVLSLDGDGDYINCGNDDIANIGTAITTAAWIKTSSMSSSDTVIGKGWAWRLNGGPGGIMRFQVSDTKPTGSQAAGSTNVNDGKWHHVAGTYDGKEYNVYVDGKLDGYMQATGGIDTWDGYWFCIGAHFKKTDTRDPRYFWDGLIDDVRVYDGALSANEILWISGFAPLASEPSPADRQTDVAQNVVLGWKPGVYADKHDVYFGKSLADVSQATTTSDPNSVYKGRQNPNEYPVSETLDLEKTYYWRIDEVNGPPDFTIFRGNVWEFTVEPFVYPIQNVTAKASSNAPARGPENTVNGSGLDGSGLLHTNEGDNYMWLSSPDGVLPTWLEFQFDKVYKLHQMWVWNFNESLETTLGIGCKDVSIEYSVNGTDYTALGTSHRFARAPGTPNYAHNTTVDFGDVAAKYVRLIVQSNWGGILNQYGLSEVRFLYIPVSARKPNPASGATDVDLDVVLSFRAGREAATHDVYFGKSIPPPFIGKQAQNSYEPGPLELSTTYYWRIDESNEAQTPATWEGDLWSFTTRQFLIVDDFESYNDFDTTDPASNRIFNTWIDGYGVPTNGSIVGYDGPPFAERTIVHGGKQSMPLFYNNTAGKAYSEAECTFAVGQDWTKAGSRTLVLFFYGTAGNTGQLYAKVNGSKAAYGGNAGDIAIPQWKQWNIDLAALNVNLQNVTKLSIGIDGNGASGKLYFDDIRLYRLAP